MGLFLDSDEVATDEEISGEKFLAEVTSLMESFAESLDEEEEATREEWMNRLLAHLGIEKED